MVKLVDILQLCSKIQDHPANDPHHGILQILSSIASYLEQVNNLEEHLDSTQCFVKVSQTLAEIMRQEHYQLDQARYNELINFKVLFDYLFILSNTSAFDVIFLHRFPNINPKSDLSALSKDCLFLCCLCFPIQEHACSTLIYPLYQRLPMSVISMMLCVLSKGISTDLFIINCSPSLIQAFTTLEFPALPAKDWLLSLMTGAWRVASYSDSPLQTEFKKKLYAMLRMTLNFHHEIKTPRRQKPCLLIPLEFDPYTTVMLDAWLGFVKTASQYFAVNILLPTSQPQANRSEYIENVFLYSDKSLTEILQIVTTLSPDIIYYFSVGIQPVITLLAALRIAPFQVFTLGDATSSCSPEMDYMITEESIVGTSELYTEKVIAIPSGSSPRIAATFQYLEQLPTIDKENKEQPISFAICSSYMKLSSFYLKTLQKIAQYCLEHNINYRFHFFTNVNGVRLHASAHFIKRYLPDAMIYPSLSRYEFLQRLQQMDIRLGSFPLGGGNSAVDAAILGIPSVCWLGERCFERSDYGVLCHLPHCDIQFTQNADEYYHRVIQFIHDENLRLDISTALLSAARTSDYLGANGLNNLREDATAQALYALYLYPDKFSEKYNLFEPVWSALNLKTAN